MKKISMTCASLLFGVVARSGCASPTSEPEHAPIPVTTSTIAPREISYFPLTSLVWSAQDKTYCGQYGAFDCQQSCGGGSSTFGGSSQGCACMCTSYQMTE